MAQTFLTAEWRHLCLFTYEVPAEQLEDCCPPGTEIDLLDGRAHLSLVAFDFLNTRVGGVAWPGFRSFPEINLRFYVRRGGARGVAFIREYVPQRLVAWIARRRYNEPYLDAPMESRVITAGDAITVEHELRTATAANSLRVTGSTNAFRPADDSVEHHFKEHQWGFGKTRDGKLVTYEVCHPAWEIYPVTSSELDWNWADAYGPKWSFLTDLSPVSVILAAGSDVSVHRPTVGG
ncbi:MAG: DUF2071 domain-containing protein [Deltaproteobacteria bacterium]|jgi:uncharacterized protein YqjF (DUF2071 family)|nr:DUF2071 domain-containing protein [Deltaproteobacteria bacterium]MBW1875559.1 DUF2071 domain-containing protein [Deltaproteobacteria bacterium]MBW2210660.1 DUF2071 domain-containing protein [Deltaproteobacteria bacterium]MBW2213844.1 DUF2071 domain-containing protein [Deltaproteobacteria bacterium]MBW2378241.1 DUF2071 domain-containing protein [Deltaproteobacteria bacterium]